MTRKELENALEEGLALVPVGDGEGPARGDVRRGVTAVRPRAREGLVARLDGADRERECKNAKSRGVHLV